MNKDFKLTEKDMHNLYDALDIATLSKMWKDTLKLNHMDKWFNSFFRRLEKVVVPELKKGVEE